MVHQEAERLSLESYGLRLAIAASSEGLLADVTAIVPAGYRVVTSNTKPDRRYEICQPDYSGDQRTELKIDDGVRLAFPEPGRAIAYLEQDLHHFLATHSRDQLFVHAGVVGWQGKAIVLPGRSFAGKTTLVQALLAIGATYYSDEYAVIDCRAMVHPFTRALRVRTKDGRPLRHIRPAELTARIGEEPIPIGIVAAIRYRPGSWAVEATSAGEGVLLLLENTVAARTRPQDAMAYLANAVSSARILKGERGSAETAARALTDCLS